ncbi:phosphatidylinositol N-acetylglucosaminyltransferase subunit Q-like isoform X2 [Uloborus diversus]|nr:phosphatidylinositol N-acetylglucosaminyltransferase subunit Q-like isoform X2 [Uloborus diversus]
MTAVGRQFHQRYLHCKDINISFSQKKVNLKTKNLISAVLLDIFCGCLLTTVLLQSSLSTLLFETTIQKTHDVVNNLQSLINWLMGFPAGLKLNAPLNNALGQFFLYHIFLWESYMVVVQPLFATAVSVSTVIGAFGLSFFLSLLNDVISLATIHIYCFYGYAARLYGYQLKSLSALWRLFRGKKWNPLRQRVDSYTYDVHQLYLGTLIFTVLLFLLPTVMVYYIVFTCLRLAVLTLQSIVFKVISVISIFPAYSILCRILSSHETAGDVYFSVFNAQSVLVLYMETIQISVMTVIKLTLPELHRYQEVIHWKDLFSSIIWGNIIYPL